MNARLVVFDWDGTLADSQGKIVACARRALAAAGGPELDDVRLRSAIGLGLPETARYLHPEGDDAFAAAFVTAYREEWLARNASSVALFAGVTETLAALRDDGRQLAVATGKSRAGLDRELSQSGLHAFVSVSRCADETASKPDPRMLHEILADTRVDPKHAVVVGDTTFDLEMARRAGTPAIAVSYGAHHRDLLAEHDPVAIVDDVRDLLHVLRQ